LHTRPQKRRLSGGVGAGATQQPGGGYGSVDEENDVVWEWRWGPRAVAEIGEAAVARFVAEFIAECAGGDGAGGEEGSDEEVGVGRARVHGDEAQRPKALLKGVELAAGRDLAGPIV